MMEQDFIPKPMEDTAEFNNALAFLERLNKIEYMIEDALMSWQHKQCFNVLESYENELSFCFKKDDEENINKIKQDIIKIFNGCPSIETKSKYCGKNIVIGSNKIPELREQIIKLNKKLRQIKHKRGMGMPTRGDGKLF